MSTAEQSTPVAIETLREFKFDRVLKQDSLNHSIYVLGTLPENVTTILSFQKTAIPPQIGENLSGLLGEVKSIDDNDIYHWMHGWFSRDNALPDLKINMISPATELHIRKYSQQHLHMLHETPEIYREVVIPYINSLPPERIQWVFNILSHQTEVDRILYEDPAPDSGFIILPDLKWDRVNVENLYLVAIAHSRTIRSLRDLTKGHLPMLRHIRSAAHKAVQQNWGLGPGSLRLYIHYHPSYYQFHVHIVTANYSGFGGMSVGQAHLLDNVISLLELDPDEGPSVFQRMTLSYTMGEQHGLFNGVKARQEDISI
jgi:m7GpppX diphosphatase